MQAVRLASTKDMSHGEWLLWRQKGIGGSDAAAICRMSRYKSPMGVYLDKLGELPPIEDNPKMKAGRMLEPIIADWFSEETGYKVQRRNAILSHPKHSFMLANIDRWLSGQNAGLECKNTAEYCKEDWSGTQAPTEYILQCNHYMAVTGADRWYIAVLIGGWDFQWRVIERDDDLIRNLITVEKEFWHDHVLAKVPPAYSHQDTEFLKTQFPTSTPNAAFQLGEDTYPIMQDLFRARADEEDAKRRKNSAANQIKGLMGENELAFFQGDLKFTWKTNKKGIRTFNVIGGDE
ncbi:YqaJ viral recombinase family nuclease [Paenibacillus tyrfis]|uniref:YqaJ viral recombinase family nuclease n=1 Tax=Paenibacillus tyrfis TaxID=1501230 RepID=UPI000B58BDF1|nr:YqaJ viral recombinase family protein [Paenibacillus tyrfis]